MAPLDQTESDELYEGFWLMVVGMVTVFGFLSTLVAMMTVSAALFESYAHLFPEPVTEPTRSTSSDDDARIAVVLAAIAAHRTQG